MLRSAASEQEWRNHRVVEAGVGIEIGRTKRLDSFLEVAVHTTFTPVFFPSPLDPRDKPMKYSAGWLLSFFASNKQTQSKLRVWSKVIAGTSDRAQKRT